jgi:hypothetical protein
MSSRIVNEWATLPLRHLWKPIIAMFRAWPLRARGHRAWRLTLAYWLFGGWAIELLLLTIYVWAALLWITLVLGWLVFGITLGLALRLVWFRWPRITPDKEQITDADETDQGPDQ